MLGPCLFIIYINDIEAAVDTILRVKKFADDTKACAVADNNENCQAIQKQIDELFKWSVDWQMLFNLDKCKIIHLGKDNLKFDYTLRGTPLIKADSEKDLGVYLDNSLTPSKHIAEAVKKANKMLGQLLRTISYRDRVHFLKLYKQHVRCHLEYAVQAWNPWLKKDTDLMESVQKRAVRCIKGLHGSYEEKLIQLNLPSLVERRKRGDMIQTYKIIHQIDKVDPKTWFQFRDNRPTRGNMQIDNGGIPRKKLSLNAPWCQTDVRRNFYSNRVVRPWNELPEDVKNAKSVSSFKNTYDKFMLSVR